MKRWKTILNKLLWPGWKWVILTVILSALALFMAFGTRLRDTAFAYATYCLSAYGLTVFMAAVVPMVLRLPQFLHDVPLARRYLTDKYFAVWYGLALSFLINLGFAVLKLVYAVWYASFWEGGLAIYNILLCAVRLYLLASFPKGQKRFTYREEMRRYQVTGRFLFFLDAALAVISTMIVLLLPAKVGIMVMAYQAELHCAIQVFLYSDQITRFPIIYDGSNSKGQRLLLLRNIGLCYGV